MAGKLRIALAGNPNSGKTTLFNALTGSNQRVGNWPGVTVEKKDGLFKADRNIVIQDLPGIYSLSPYSLEETVARTYLVEQGPDAIVNIVDGTNIERNLYLTTQLAELGIPMVIAVNMMDVVGKNGDRIDFAQISKAFGCPVVGISAQKNEGCTEAVNLAAAEVRKHGKIEPPHVFTGAVERCLAHIEEALPGTVGARAIRWYAVKIFERDSEIVAALNLPQDLVRHVFEHVRDCEKRLGDDSESLVTNQRYDFIGNLKDKAIVKNEARRSRMTMSDRIDRIVTHRVLALPIFALSLCVMWFLAVSERGPGTVLTDWANDGILGDGWHLPFTTHAYVCRQDGCGCTGAAQEAHSTACVCTACAQYAGMTFEDACGEFAKQSASKTAWQDAYREAYDKRNGEGAYEKARTSANEFKVLDAALARTVVAKDVFVEDEETGEPAGNEDGEAYTWDVDYAGYQKAVAYAEPDPSAFGTWVPGIGALIGAGLEKIGASEMVASLVCDGAWGGVATVLGFIPVITVVFLFLAFLEDCGYMARVAFIMDRVFRTFGLSGKSFIPMIVGKGCGVPAVMAARTIGNERDRRMTVILATFIPCGAKTVLIAMFMALFFRGMWYMAPLMDVIGIAIIVLGGIALKKSRAFAGEAAPFVMELPAYHLPTVRGVLIHTWERVKGYMIKAGVIIFPACVFLWFIMHFDWRLNLLSDGRLDQSILHDIGTWIAWIFKPLGFGTWQGAVATVSAEIAKEQATATLGLVAANMDGATTGSHVIALFRSFSDFPGLAAFSFLVFNLFVPPCVVAIAATFREMGSAKWGWFATGFQLFAGYALALSCYQIGVFACGGGFSVWTALALAVDAFVAWAVFRPAPKGGAK